jgi:type 1 glutamine amidotransferase
MQYPRALAVGLLVVLGCGSSGPPGAAPAAPGGSRSPDGGLPPADAAAPIASPPAPSDADASPPDSPLAITTVDARTISGPQAVLVYTRATGFVHDSIGAAASSVTAALRAAGVTVDASADPAVFTPANLARYAGVVLVSTTGKPLGDPGTAALDALAGFVRGGGALVGLHAASSTLYDPALPYTPLVGGKFIDHPGGVRNAVCHPVGMHPSVAQLPAAFPVHDEIYSMDHLNPANVVDLRCDALGGGPALPVAWHRDEGMGRVFYTALGHDGSEWAATAVLFKSHVLPGLLWALGR